MDADMNITATFAETALPEYTLTISVTGPGSVNVNGDPFAGALQFEEGTEVTIEAVAEENAEFEGWTGSITATQATQTFTMDADKNITATFTETAVPEYTLTITVTGPGLVSVNGDTYTEPLQFDEGTEVTIDAAAEANAIFEGWTGSITATQATQTFTMDANKNITAEFVLVTQIRDAEKPAPGIFPNPFTDQLTISNPGSFSRITLLNVTGQVIGNYNIIDLEEKTISTGNLEKGIYLLRFEKENGINLVIKMVKQ
ncbi:MAG: T9SS C-terminal target domain-containing protein [Marinilabiliales bacterium]|nr:MAG: T9SS C-terminal target domain-containing protein [Marinilabiliales bacterium]